MFIRIELGIPILYRHLQIFDNIFSILIFANDSKYSRHSRVISYEVTRHFYVYAPEFINSIERLCPTFVLMKFPLSFASN